MSPTLDNHATNAFWAGFSRGGAHDNAQLQLTKKISATDEQKSENKNSIILIGEGKTAKLVE